MNLVSINDVKKTTKFNNPDITPLTRIQCLTVRFSEYCPTTWRGAKTKNPIQAQTVIQNCKKYSHSYFLKTCNSRESESKFFKKKQSLKYRICFMFESGCFCHKYCFLHVPVRAGALQYVMM